MTFTFSKNSNYGRKSLIRQNFDGWCQQTFCYQKFVDNAQQCFAFTRQANFPTHYLNFYWRWWDRIQATFKIFSTLTAKGVNQEKCFSRLSNNCNMYKSFLFCKKEILWEGHISQFFDITYLVTSSNILWPSHNIWTL